MGVSLSNQSRGFGASAWRRSRAGACAALLLAALPARAAGPEPLPVSVPQRFFLGTTEGVGRLKIMLRKARATHVRSVGRLARDGALILDQVVEQEGEPIRRRQWLLRDIGQGRLSGTISDARGPVTGEVTGNLLHLTYRMMSGEKAEQWVRVAPDGRSAQNHMVITKFGMSVATLDETIRRTDK